MAIYKKIMFTTGVGVALLVSASALLPTDHAEAQSRAPNAVLAPDFTLQSLAGERYTLSGLRGKVVLVNFWATWCPPCRREIPDLSRIYTEYKDQGLMILGISLDDLSKEEIQRFARNYKIPYPILHGARSELGKVAKAYGGVNSIPTTFLVDRDGYIRDMFIGSRDEETFLQSIRPLL